MSTVYVVQEQPNHNISPALKYGSIRVMLPYGDINFTSQEAYAKLLEHLREFDARTDYLLLTGDPSAIALAAIAVTNMMMETDTIRFLKWDRQTCVYIPVETTVTL